MSTTVPNYLDVSTTTTSTNADVDDEDISDGSGDDYRTTRVTDKSVFKNFKTTPSTIIDSIDDAPNTYFNTTEAKLIMEKTLVYLTLKQQQKAVSKVKDAYITHNIWELSYYKVRFLCNYLKAPSKLIRRRTVAMF